MARLVFSFLLLFCVLTYPLEASLIVSEDLNLDNSGIDDAKLVKVIQHPSLSHLYVLSLANNKITDKGVQTIAHHMTQLGVLNLANNPLTQEGIKTLAASMTNLWSLTLSCVPLDEDTVSLMSRYLTNLCDLTLISTALKDSSATILTRRLMLLVNLNLTSNMVGASIRNALTSTPHPFLKILNLTANNLTSVHLIMLTPSPYPLHLRELYLPYNKITSSGLIYIASHHTALEILDLSHNLLGNDKLNLLAQRLPSLKFLNIEHNAIGPPGILSLASVPFQSLILLNIRFNPVQDEGRRALIQLAQQKRDLQIIH